MTEGTEPQLSATFSRRDTLHSAALLAATGALAWPGFTSAQSTPVAGATGGLLLVQAFSTGSLFPTQGEAGVLPYTLYLWDAADRGLFFTSAEDHVAGFAPSASLILAIAAGERPRAAVVVPTSAGAQQVWAMRLAFAGLGSDPGEMTYQGEALDEAEAAAWLGMTPTALPDGVEQLTFGYLVITGLPALDLPESEHVRIALA